MGKTAKEIQDLKDNWLGDPCWDIEATEGFEEHYTELYKWRTELEQEEQVKEARRLSAKAMVLGCSVELVGYIEALERRIRLLEQD